jgi:hypothetical protein
MSCECYYYAFNVIDLGSNPTRKTNLFKWNKSNCLKTLLCDFDVIDLVGFKSDPKQKTFSIATRAMALDMHQRLHDFCFCWKFGYNKRLTIFWEFNFFLKRKSIPPKSYRYYAIVINSQHVQHPMSEFQSFMQLLVGLIGY